MSRVVADRDVCVGSGNCVLTDPAVFDQDDDGLVILLDAEPGSDHDQDLITAVRRCPSGALRLTDLP